MKNIILISALFLLGGFAEIESAVPITKGEKNEI